MQLSRIEKPYFVSTAIRLLQADILRNAKFVESATVVSGEIEISERELGYCVVITQDCDLEHDFNNRSQKGADNDKYLQTILVCPAYGAESFRAGEHLKAANLQMGRFNSDQWRNLKSNNLYRYHWLPAHSEFSVPELILDFKHYITIPRDVLYEIRFKGNYLATVSELFRENLSLRFANYLSRIGLPELC